MMRTSNKNRRLSFEPLEARRVLATFVVTNTMDSGAGSLREAIQTANGSPGTDLISFDPAIPDLTINLATELTVSDGLIIDASALSQHLTIDLESADSTPTLNDGGGIRAFNVDDGDPNFSTFFQLENIRIQGGDASGSGGAIQSQEALFLINMEILNNNATVSGGGVSATIHGGDFVVADSVVSGNTSPGDGGGLDLRLDQVVGSVTRNEIANNSSGGIGGGASVYADGGTFLSLSENTISDNFALTHGGGVKLSADDSTVRIQGDFLNNVAETGSGGGLHATSTQTADVSMEQSIVTGNQAAATGGSQGGGVLLEVSDDAVATIASSEVSGNSGILGGGIAIQANPDGLAIVRRTTVESNDAFAGGGGIHARSTGGTIEIDHVVATNNVTQAEQGGGIAVRTFQSDAASVSISNSVASGNSALAGGGFGLFVNSGNVTLSDSTAENNFATFGGGVSAHAFGVSPHSAAVSISGVTVFDNESGSTGGGITAAADQGTVDIANSTISGNTTRNGGGGIMVSSGFNSPPIISLRHLTVVDNESTYRVQPPSLTGGGGISTDSISHIILTHSIVANNLSDGADGDLYGSFQADHNLIEAPEAVTLTGSGNITGQDPQILPLANNGGSTETHNLLQSSPAVNSGDPGFTSPPDLDQRGFIRVQGGRIDIGAIETPFSQVDGDIDDNGVYDCLDVDAVVAEIVSGNHSALLDLTGDGLVDHDDLDAWLFEAGMANVGGPYLYGDGNLDGVVDIADFNLWNDNKFTNAAAWCRADFNASGNVDTSDFNSWNNNKFQSSNPFAIEPVAVTPIESFLAASEMDKFQDESESGQARGRSLIDRVFATQA